MNTNTTTAPEIVRTYADLIEAPRDFLIRKALAHCLFRRVDPHDLTSRTLARMILVAIHGKEACSGL